MRNSLLYYTVVVVVFVTLDSLHSQNEQKAFLGGTGTYPSLCRTNTITLSR